MIRSWRRTASLTMVTALLASTIVAFPSIASADDEVDAASIAVAAQSLANLDESLLLAASDGAGTGTVQTSQGTIGVPSRLTDGVSIHSPGRSPLTIDLPEADAAGDAVLLQGGAVTYPGESLTNSVIVGDAGVQMLTTITSADAPEHLEYDVDLGVGESLRSTEDGAAVVAADGTVLAVVADAWALDADGDPVATHYEIEGSTLIQVVDHRAAGVAYPVVADPIWIAPWVFKCLLGLGLKGPQITQAFATGTIWGGLGAAALACALGK